MSTSRPRAPLANIPNATNSPHRTITQSTKRARVQASIQQENEPPQKRQMIDRDAANPHGRKLPPSTTEGRVFERGSVGVQPTAFQRKLVAARDRGTTLKITKNVDAPTAQSVENIRQWQKHYRKAFPEFNFFFESVPEELKARFSQYITNLGAVRLPLLFPLSLTCWTLLQSLDSLSHLSGATRHPQQNPLREQS